MELMPGYKLSDVGVIPDDWDAKPLGEIGDSLIGLTYRPSEVRKYGTLVLRSSNVQNGVLCFDDNVFVDADIPERIMVRPGDILVCVRNGSRDLIGKSALIDERAIGMTFGAFMAVFRSEHGKLLHHVFQSGVFKKQINEHLGATINQITNRSLNSFKVPLPSTNEERTEIANALSNVDALLTTLDLVISKKRDLKQAAMQKLLTGEIRLPGFSGEWGVKQIGEFTDCTAGGTPSTLISSYWGGEIPWMSSGELHLKRVEEVEGRITELGLNSSSTKIVPRNCVLVGLAGQGKTRGTVAINLIALCTNQSIAAIFPNPSFISEYLYYNLDARYDELRELSTGDGGRGGLNLKIIKAITIPFPSLQEQKAIAAVFADMDAELSALESRRYKAKELKQAMMQELLTGKTRLIAKEESHV
ncbi:MAG: restriction endonuclease subunit S [Deltaproteobacteria bacterium]|nr:restriction endonuclease subunit S [Deltaproteobacteria bacterium]